MLSTFCAKEIIEIKTAGKESKNFFIENYFIAFQDCIDIKPGCQFKSEKLINHKGSISAPIFLQIDNLILILR